MFDFCECCIAFVNDDIVLYQLQAGNITGKLKWLMINERSVKLIWSKCSAEPDPIFQEIAGVVDKAEEYRYSSARNYYFGRKMWKEENSFFIIDPGL